MHLCARATSTKNARNFDAVSVAIRAAAAQDRDTRSDETTAASRACSESPVICMRSRHREYARSSARRTIAVSTAGPTFSTNVWWISFAAASTERATLRAALASNSCARNCSSTASTSPTASSDTNRSSKEGFKGSVRVASFIPPPSASCSSRARFARVATALENPDLAFFQLAQQVVTSSRVASFAAASAAACAATSRSSRERAARRGTCATATCDDVIFDAISSDPPLASEVSTTPNPTSTRERSGDAVAC
mmetsp:Transcript_5616/g.21259  ORF Transcript_5616/g.21259 Transcript_5616/m.21259 type:complete len:253 (-) Transcript_5616:797-1555(-)